MGLPVIIGIGHKRRRGKDVLAEMMSGQAALQGFETCTRPFAYALKEHIGAGIFGLTEEQLYGDQKTIIDPFWELTPRDILQRGGTESMRDVFGQDIWVKVMQRFIEHCPAQVILIPDVRFPNEAEAVKRWGGTLIKVERDIEHAEEDTHISETALDDFDGWDHTVNNNSSLGDLKATGDSLLRLLL